MLGRLAHAFIVMHQLPAQPSSPYSDYMVHPRTGTPALTQPNAG